MKQLLVILVLALTACAQDETERDQGVHWHQVDIYEFANTRYTHVEVTGAIKTVNPEADGDFHVWLCDPHDPKDCIIAECIEAISDAYVACGRLHQGDMVTLRGISRYDRWHNWPELHPVIEVQKVRGGQ